MSGTDIQINSLQNKLKTIINENLKKLLKEEGLTVSGVKSELQGRLLSRIRYYADTGNTAALETLSENITHMMRPNSVRQPPVNTPPSSLSPHYPSQDPRGGPHAANLYPTSMAVPVGVPSRAIKFKQSPFYEIERVLAGPVECKVRENTRDHVDIKITLSPDMAASLQSDRSLRVMVYCACETGLSAFTMSDIQFPHQVELKVNLDDVKANLRGLKNKPGSTRPADITDYLRKKPGYVNNVVMTYALTQKDGSMQKFYVVVHLVRKIAVDYLVEKLKAGKVITKDQVLRDMRNRNQDADIVATSTVMSLKCPLSTLRIDVPCRSMQCSHNQCFDAASFLQLQEQAPTWTCPVCNKTTSFESLTIDLYVQDILSQTARNVEQVTIEPTGTWTKLTAPDTPNPSHSPADDSDNISDDLVEVPSFQRPTYFKSELMTPTTQTPPTSSREPSRPPNGTSSNKRPASAVVDLTLSSDDDDEPLRPAKRPSLASSGPSSSSVSQKQRMISFGMPSRPSPGAYGQSTFADSSRYR